MKDIKQDNNQETVTLGFWLYLMTDCLLFATLFASYAVLRNNTAGSVSGPDIFDTSFVLTQTILLLSSSLASGLALLSARFKKQVSSLIWLGVTMVLGAAFLIMEIYEFTNLISEGHSWQASAFLSAFFTLVGTHGAHIAIGLLWATVLVVLILRKGLKKDVIKKFSLFTLFWHFLDVIWIFIFTFVYAVGSKL